MKRFLFIIVFSFVVLASCQKDELTLPAKVIFEFGMYSAYHDSETKNYQYNPNESSPYFLIESGVLIVDAIEFDGRREEGQDFYFISVFPEPVVAILSDLTTNFDVEFDIPQGVYKKIDIVFHLSNIDRIPLILEGVFKAGNIEKKIRFEHNYSEKITIKASNKQQGQNNIILRKDKLSSALTIVDADLIFRFISVGQIMNAETTYINEIPNIIINNQHNTDIYNSIAPRIQNSLKVVFE
ncbi:MAG: hypothetical protein KGZ97_02895 [Bacteroidetes bacterium]|nr:hypothetical protein [Bacteroidota bacterium]